MHSHRRKRGTAAAATAAAPIRFSTRTGGWAAPFHEIFHCHCHRAGFAGLLDPHRYRVAARNNHLISLFVTHWLSLATYLLSVWHPDHHRDSWSVRPPMSFTQLSHTGCPMNVPLKGGQNRPELNDMNSVMCEFAEG